MYTYRAAPPSCCARTRLRRHIMPLHVVLRRITASRCLENTLPSQKSLIVSLPPMKVCCILVCTQPIMDQQGPSLAIYDY